MSNTNNNINLIKLCSINITLSNTNRSKRIIYFCYFSEQVVCPTYVGRTPDYLPRNGTNWAHLLINNAFPCDGSVLGWEYYRLIPTGVALVGVWRQSSDSEFTLIRKSVLPPGSVGKRTVHLQNPIDVQRGDFIGIFYPRETAHNVIASATVEDNTVSASELFQDYFVEMFDDLVQEGVPFNINQVPFSTTNATFAIRALMKYSSAAFPTGKLFNIQLLITLLITCLIFSY